MKTTKKRALLKSLHPVKKKEKSKGSFDKSLNHLGFKFVKYPDAV